MSLVVERRLTGILPEEGPLQRRRRQAEANRVLRWQERRNTGSSYAPTAPAGAPRIRTVVPKLLKVTSRAAKAIRFFLNTIFLLPSSPDHFRGRSED